MAENSRRQSNIRPLNPRIAQQIVASDAKREAGHKHFKRAHRLRRKRIIGAGLAVACVFLVQLVLGQVRLHAANQTLNKTELTLQKTQKDNQDLRKKSEQLKDPAYLQQILRDKYGYSRKGEIIYNLPNQS
ncbi:FtsB family cell division protein [Fructobacillus ficulneus]|uniref:Septum formation initiator n=1 Tax=Fructobacillus ficulneus TaxID=157463 RepID=A0A0K8MFQ6_9LACO|nr:septum formation initiator family protein [Fructobacillus ficulneus]GAO99371.1 septum formation initiator [Fructobacillus ficulneus]